jgi:hypothetical protein
LKFYWLCVIKSLSYHCMLLLFGHLFEKNWAHLITDTSNYWVLWNIWWGKSFERVSVIIIVSIKWEILAPPLVLFSVKDYEIIVIG